MSHPNSPRFRITAFPDRQLPVPAVHGWELEWLTDDVVHLEAARGAPTALPTEFVLREIRRVSPGNRKEPAPSSNAGGFPFPSGAEVGTTTSQKVRQRVA